MRLASSHLLLCFPRGITDINLMFILLVPSSDLRTHIYIWIVLSYVGFLFAVLGIKPRTLCTRGKCCITESHP
jgi:hypothetical protein